MGSIEFSPCVQVTVSVYLPVPGASPNPCSIVYHGPTPFSESEVRNLATYTMGLGEGVIDAFISTHSYSQLILYPYHHTGVPSADDAALVSRIGAYYNEHTPPR